MATIKCSVTKSSWYEMYIEYSIQGDAANNQSVISHSLKIKQLKNDIDFDGMMNVAYYVAGQKYTYNALFNMNDKGNAGYTMTVVSGHTTLGHDEKGDASFKVSCSGACNSGGYGPGTISLEETTVQCPRLPLFNLHISAGTGSNITVDRTSSGGSGDTGALSGGNNKLYYGDKLKISFSATTNYEVGNHTVNGSSFTSGNTHTVAGNVSVVSTATPLKSSISATDAFIESVSTIIVQKHNASYTHTITYRLGDESGTIVAESTDTTIPWTVPSAFYAQIPNNVRGVCTLTCETFNGATSIGTSTCDVTVTASTDKCSPSLSATVVDVNSVTKALTGDDSVLVRYKSTASCTVVATAKNHATIQYIYLGNDSLPFDTEEGAAMVTTQIQSPSEAYLVFATVDSRGYAEYVAKTPVLIAYTNLTCNPLLSRPTPTGSSVVMSISGDMFRGSFGQCSNTLEIQYRYKESDGSFGGWQSLDMSNIVFGTSSYRSAFDIELEPYPGDEGFDYNKEYVFEITAADGGVVDGVRYDLSKVTKRVTVTRGIPVFDWGENDFNVNVPLMLNNVNILDIMYPIGTVYMHTSSTLPTAISGIGTWTSVTAELSGVYAWERTA